MDHHHACTTAISTHRHKHTGTNTHKHKALACHTPVYAGHSHLLYLACIFMHVHTVCLRASRALHTCSHTCATTSLLSLLSCRWLGGTQRTLLGLACTFHFHCLSGGAQAARSLFYLKQHRLGALGTAQSGPAFCLICPSCTNTRCYFAMAARAQVCMILN